MKSLISKAAERHNEELAEFQLDADLLDLISGGAEGGKKCPCGAFVSVTTEGGVKHTTVDCAGC